LPDKCPGGRKKFLTFAFPADGKKEKTDDGIQAMFQAWVLEVASQAIFMFQIQGETIKEAANGT
jgi:hypothetical protein